MLTAQFSDMQQVQLDTPQAYYQALNANSRANRAQKKQVGPGLGAGDVLVAVQLRRQAMQTSLPGCSRVLHAARRGRQMQQLAAVGQLLLPAAVSIAACLLRPCSQGGCSRRLVSCSPHLLHSSTPPFYLQAPDNHNGYAHTCQPSPYHSPCPYPSALLHLLCWALPPCLLLGVCRASTTRRASCYRRRSSWCSVARCLGPTPPPSWP
jgi:hypothetical protein